MSPTYFLHLETTSIGFRHFVLVSETFLHNFISSVRAFDSYLPSILRPFWIIGTGLGWLAFVSNDFISSNSNRCVKNNLLLLNSSMEHREYFKCVMREYFSSFTFCAIPSRLFAGTLSDKYGRIIVIRIAIVLLSISYILFGFSSSPHWLIAFSGLVGFSLGIAIPAIMAWTVDRGSEESRGKDIATFFIGLEMAIGVGALVGAEIYNNDASQFYKVFVVIGIITFIALFFTRMNKAISP